MNQHQMNASTLQYYFGQNLDFADVILKIFNAKFKSIIYNFMILS